METKRQVLFFTLESPWPGYGGAGLRKQGLIKEIAKEFRVHIVVLSKNPMDEIERANCYRYADEVTEIIMKNIEAMIAFKSIMRSIPYHAAAVLSSFSGTAILREALSSENIIYCTGSHFAILARRSGNNRNWIIDQFDAEIEYWKIRMHEYRNPLKKMLSYINLCLVKRTYYESCKSVGGIICVSKEDKAIIERSLPGSRVDIIENGVDTSYYKPGKRNRVERTPTMLFTGTSNKRNMRALERFIKQVFPRVRDTIKDVKFIVAGDFDKKAQKKLDIHDGIEFTGRIDDIRPFYDQCDVFVNPFYETYGSKLKVSQALSMGVCIVTTDIGARGFHLEDGKTALIVRNNKELVQKILIVLENREIRDMIGANGRRFAEENLDWNILGIKLRSILNGINQMN